MINLQSYILIAIALFFINILFYNIYLDSKLYSNKLINKTLSPKNNNIYLYLGIIILFIVLIATRCITNPIDGVAFGGMDAHEYRKRFLNSNMPLFESLRQQGNEPGYSFLVWLMRCFTDNFTIFLIIYYIILFFLAIKSLDLVKASEISFLVILVYITIPFIISLNLMRQILAYFLIANALNYYLKNKKLNSYIFTLLAVTIHYSSVIFIPVLFISFLKNKFRFNYKTGLLIVLGIILTIIITRPLLATLLKGTRYHVYFLHGGELAYGQMLYHIAIIVFILLAIKKLSEVDFFILILFSMFFLAFALQISLPIAYRMYGFTDLALLILIPQIYNGLSDNINFLNISKNLGININLILKLLFCLMLCYLIWSFFAVTVLEYSLILAW